MKTYRCEREVLEAVEQVLARKPRLAARGRQPLREIRGAQSRKSPLDQVARLLQDGRHYFAVSIFLEAGGRLLRVASAGPAPRCDFMPVGEGNVGQASSTGVAKVVPDVTRDPQYVKVFPETRSELVMPIKIGVHVIGVIDAESDRLNAFAYAERVLLHNVATRLARFLSAGGKHLVMEAREAAQNMPQASPARPQPEQQERLRAAAADKSHS